MNFSRKATNKETEIDIQDYYAIKFSSLWRGFKQEHLSFFALCLYFFFEYVRPQSIYPIIDVVPWAQITLIVTIVAAFFDKSVTWVSNIENKLIILLLFIIILSGVFAFNSSVSLANAVFFLNWFIVYFLVINILNTEKRLFIFILLFLLFNFKMSQHGFLSWTQRGFSFSGWGLAGAPGWFANSGEFAITLLIFISLAASFIFGIHVYLGRYMKFFLYLMPITGFISILGTSSRGGQLGLAVMGFWLLLKWKHRIRAIIVLTVLFIVVGNLIPEEQIQRFRNSGEDNTSLQRIAYWKLGMDIMQEYPLLGIGYYNWRDYLNYIEPDGIGVLRKNELAHNTYIQAGSELGFIGLLVYITMIVIILSINASTRKLAMSADKKFLCSITYGLDAGLIGYLVSSFFISTLYYPFFWVQLALSVAVFSVVNGEFSVNIRKNGRQKIFFSDE